MKKVIFKYQINSPEIVINLPLNSKPLYSAYQNSSIVVWVEQDEITDTEYAERYRFVSIWTGEPFEVDKDLNYLSTICLYNDSQIHHIYWRSLGTTRLR